MGGIRDAKHPNQASLWESKIQLGERFFHEIITNPLPINMKILKAIKRSPLGLDLWLTYRTFGLTRSLRLTWPLLYRQFGVDPAKAGDKLVVNDFRKDCLRELKKIKDAWPDLHYRTVTGARSSSRRRRRASRRHNCVSWNSDRVGPRGWPVRDVRPRVG